METPTNPTLRQFLKNRILWKVYTMWFLRRIVPLIVLQVAAIALALQIFAKNVFVSMVFRNAAVASEQGYWAFLGYLWYAFLNTRPLVQVTVLVILGVVALLIRDVVRMVMTYATLKVRGDRG
ncbi:MAG: hypothetical protein KGI60_00050 [Patescibacteria group bacterium]|nr:hypothetical protein [Patescibacteria group bacterium]